MKNLQLSPPDATLDPITLAESQRFVALETTITKGREAFLAVAAALSEIRDARLYRSDHSTFEQYCREKWGFTRQYVNQAIAGAEAVKALPAGMETIVSNQGQARALAKVPEELRVEVLEAATERGPVTAAVITEIAAERTPGGKAHVSHNSGENEWYTPAEYTEAAWLVMGGIDCDPASSEIANRTVKAKRFYGKEQDGLKRKWNGRVFLNPPYAQPLIAQFAEAAACKFESEEIEQAVVLVNNATETAWFARIAEQASAICFPSARIKFLDPDGKPGAPLQGQAVLYLGDQPDRFSNGFQKFGTVWISAKGATP